MQFKATKNLVDVRNNITKHNIKKYYTRSLRSIKNIAIHHSLTKQGNAAAFAKYHVNHNGWPGIGYHFVIPKNGTVEWCNNLETKSYHVGNSNIKAVGICLVGDFRTEQPTEKQLNSLFTLVNALLQDLNLTYNDVLGHSEFPNYAWKLCPCIDMDDLRKKIKNNAKTLSVNTAMPAATVPKFYTIQNGDSIWQIANNFEGITVIDILRLNPDINPIMLKKGQTIQLK